MAKNLASADQSHICTTEPTLPCLIADIARENREVALIISTAIAISIVLFVLSKSIAAIIIAWRSNK